MCDRVARRCAQLPGQDRGTAVVGDRSPSPRSSRGLSTLCPPRLFGIGDRRHGQSVDNPASRSAIDPAGISFKCRRGGLRVARGSFRWRSTQTEHRPFHVKSAWTGSAPNTALSRRSRPFQHRMKHRPFHWAPPGRAGCASLHGFRQATSGTDPLATRKLTPCAMETHQPCGSWRHRWRGCPRLVRGADPLRSKRRCGQGVDNPQADLG